MNHELIEIVLHVLLQGLIYSLVVMGVYLSSRVIKFDDLTTEGSFGCGGAVGSILIVMGLSSWLALPVAMVVGAMTGMITGILHTKFNMNNLISGLVVTTGLFSICLKVAGSNIAFSPDSSIFATIDASHSIGAAIAIVGLLVTGVFFGVRLLLQSELGLLLRALGSNPQFIISLGKSVDTFKIFGLAVANSLTALAGCLLVQWNGFFSITGNIGTLVIGLAGLILGEVIKPQFGIGLILGAILYQAIFAVTIEFELEPVWNNLIKAVLIVILIQLKTNKEPLLVR